MSYTKVLNFERGGTTGNTQTSGFNALDPITTKGDIIVHDGTNSVRQAIGSNGQVLTADSAQTNGLKWADVVATTSNFVKQQVRLATTANLDLTGAETIDGVSTATNDRILVKDQSTGSENGIYLANNSGAWTRATDFDTSAEVLGGLLVSVSEGTANGNSVWTLTTDDPITLASTSLTFAEITGLYRVTAGGGLTKTGNTIDVVGTTNRITVNADSIDISSSYVGQATITTLGTITTGVWNGTDIAVADGGTGASTATAGFNNLSPTTTKGDLITRDSSDNVRQAVGSNGQILVADSTQTTGIKWAFAATTGLASITNADTPYTAVASHVILADASSGAITINLPAASGNSGRVYRVKKTDSSSNNVTLDGNASETIDGATTYALTLQYEAVDLVCNGSNWFLF